MARRNIRRLTGKPQPEVWAKLLPLYGLPDLKAAGMSLENAFALGLSREQLKYGGYSAAAVEVLLALSMSSIS